MKPKIPCTDKAFSYTNSGDMDSQYLKWRFVKIRKDEEKKRLESQREAEKTIVQIRRKA